LGAVDEAVVEDELELLSPEDFEELEESVPDEEDPESLFPSFLLSPLELPLSLLSALGLTPPLP
jgi:hypothetical protein